MIRFVRGQCFGKSTTHFSRESDENAETQCGSGDRSEVQPLFSKRGITGKIKFPNDESCVMK